MVDVGDSAPEFTAPLATGDDIEQFTLSDALTDGAVVLAFFPAAFTNVCTGEMRTFSDRIATLTDAGAQLYGVSVDTPFTLNEFHQQNDLAFPLISDFNQELIDAYDIETSFEALGVHGIAKRAVFVIDSDGAVTYAWVSDDLGVEPDYDAVEAAAVEA